MKTEEELDAFIQSELVPLFDRYEAVRLAARKKAASAAGILLLLGLIVGGILGAASSAVLGAIVFGIALIIAAVAFFHTGAKVTAFYKAQIVRPLIRFFDPSLDYLPESGMAESDFRRSGLFGSYDRYRAEDLVRGRYNGIDVAFSELHVEEKTETTDKDGHTHTEWHDVFRGVFFIADFNKNFAHRTYVLPDVAESLFGSYLGNMLQKCNLFQKGKLVKLEDPAFEKLFAVYADDQVEARYLLTPKMMERITGLRNLFRNKLYLAFLDSKLYCAVESSDNRFEVSDRQRLDAAKVRRTAGEIASILGIADSLELDLRIWSKE